MTDIATIPKNSQQEFRVSLDKFQGYELLNVRVWYRAADGEMRPGKQGVAINVALVPKLDEAIKKAMSVNTGGAA